MSRSVFVGGALEDLALVANTRGLVRGAVMVGQPALRLAEGVAIGPSDAAAVGALLAEHHYQSAGGSGAPATVLVHTMARSAQQGLRVVSRAA